MTRLLFPSLVFLTLHLVFLAVIVALVTAN